MVFAIDTIGGAVAHTGGSLLAHLFGTYEILSAWDCPQWICDAGLFHSIYGTAGFPGPLAGPVDRASLRRLIGVRGEHLVQVFSRMSPTSFADAVRAGVEPYRLADRDCGAEMLLDAGAFSALCHVAAANWVEQASRHAINTRPERGILSRLAGRLDDPGRCALLACIAAP